MIVAIGAYNIYEIRRSSELVQNKIQGLADYSARQGEKFDRMITALELYVGKRFTTNDPAATNTITESRVEKAIEFLETWKGTRIKADRPLTAEEKHIVEIARRAVATNDTWVDRAEFEIPKRDGSNWYVLVWRLPHTPGGHRSVVIDETGKVTKYIRGK